MLTGVITSLVCLSASAAEMWAAPVKITRIYPLSDGSVVLTIDNDNNTCSSPSNPKYYQITVGQNGVTADALKNMLAVSLSAFAMNRSVSINFSDSSSYCYVNRLYIQ